MTTVLQGATVTLVAQISQYPDGPPADLTGTTIQITTADGATTILAATSTGIAHPATGLYTYDWAVPADQTPGGYLATWSGTDASSNTVTTTELVTVAAVPTYAAQLVNARRYDRVPYRGESINGTPIKGAHATLWDAPTGGNQVTNITTLAGASIPGGILVADDGGWFPGFLDLDKTPNLYIIGSETGQIDGVERVLIEPSDTDDRVLSLETHIVGPDGIDDRIAALEAAAGPGGSGGAGVTITDLVARTYNVLSYGAKADGTSDDQPGIQAALNAAAAAGGGVVVIPPGEYRLSTFLDVFSDTTVWAYGAKLTAIGNTGLLRNFASADTYSGYGGHSRINICGGIWDGNAGDGSNNTTTGETDVLNFVHGSNILVRDVTVRNVSSAHGLEFNSTSDFAAINCRFEGFRDNTGGSRQFSEAIQIDLAHSGSSSIGTYDDTPSRRGLIDGCYCGPAIDGSGNGTFGRLVGSHTSVAGTFYDDLKVVNCHADTTLAEGINALAWRNAVISGNRISSPGAEGIAVRMADDAVDSIAISGNVITGSGDAGIRVDGASSATQATNVAVTGNVVENATAAAVDLNYCDHPTVVGNAVRGGASTGIYLNSGTGGVVTGNLVVSPGSNGVNLTSQGYVTVSGNRVSNTGSNYGIFLSQSSHCLVSGNTVYRGATAGIRLSTGVDKTLVTANSVRQGSGGATAVSCGAGAGTTNTVANNDFSGFGDNTTTLSVSSGTVNKTIASTTNIGTNLP